MTEYKGRLMVTWVSDPAHGWLAVDMPSLEALGLTPRDFSEFSFRDANGVYAEEDCDAAVVIRAAKEKNIELMYREKEYLNDAPCRYMERCGPDIPYAVMNFYGKGRMNFSWDLR